MGEARPSDPLSAEWITALFLLIVVALAWINMISPRKWRLLWGATVRMRLGRQTLREDIDLQDRTLIALILVSVVITGLFGYQFAVVRGMMAPGIGGFLGLAAAVLMIVMAQGMLVKGVSWLFNADEGLGEYLYTMLLLQVVLGLVLLPISVLGSYQVTWRPVLVGAGAALILASTVARWVRALIIGRGHGNGLGHILLYLCALEIVPAAIALRSLQRLLPSDVQPL